MKSGFKKFVSITLTGLFLLSLSVAPVFAGTTKKDSNPQSCEGNTKEGNHITQNNRNGDKHYTQNNKYKLKHQHPTEPDEEKTTFNIITAFVDSNRNAVYDEGEELVAGVKVGFNNVENLGGPFLAEGFSGVDGRVELTMDFTLDESLYYYLELLETPVGYEITPAGNSLFGLDSRTGWNYVDVNTQNVVVSFGSNEMVYIPLIKSNTSTMQIKTVNSIDNTIVYQGVYYELYQYQMGQFVLIDTQISDENGICQFVDVNSEFDVYVRATNLQELGLYPYEFIGSDGNSGYIKLTAPIMEFLVTVYEG